MRLGNHFFNGWDVPINKERNGFTAFVCILLQNEQIQLLRLIKFSSGCQDIFLGASEIDRKHIFLFQSLSPSIFLIN